MTKAKRRPYLGERHVCWLNSSEYTMPTEDGIVTKNKGIAKGQVTLYERPYMVVRIDAVTWVYKSINMFLIEAIGWLDAIFLSPQTIASTIQEDGSATQRVVTFFPGAGEATAGTVLFNISTTESSNSFGSSVSSCDAMAVCGYVWSFSLVPLPFFNPRKSTEGSQA